MLPSGENRLPYLYLHPGAEAKMNEYVDQTWNGQFRLMPSKQVLKSGLFGNHNIHPRLADRIGDWIAFPQEYAYWWWTEKDNLMLGRHGGLSRAEMLVPLLALVL